MVFFSLSPFFVTVELYLLGFLFSIAKEKGLRGSAPFVTCDYDKKCLFPLKNGLLALIERLDTALIHSFVWISFSEACFSWKLGN